MKVFKGRGSIEQEISSITKVELSIRISSVSLEKQQSVLTIDMDRN